MASSGIRRGENSASWKGGITPERNSLYVTSKWKCVTKKVWERDNYSCVRCGIRKTNKDQAFHIHHIVSFSEKRLRADIDNLVLLCRECHHWVHSSNNTNGHFIATYKDYETRKGGLK